MKRIHILLFICLYFKQTSCIPTGLVDNNQIVFNAVPATPRFPGGRPNPEATTFHPPQGDVLNDTQKNESGEENGPGEEDGSQDIISARHNLPANPPCRTAFETIYEVEEVEKEEQKCTTINERKCETTLLNKCVPYVENVCQTISRNICNTEFRQECQQIFREEEQSYVEDKCETITVKKCEKYWKVVSDNRKVWEENPDKCQDILETNCSPITKTRVNKVPYNECIQVPYEKCNQVQENVCNDIPKEKCNLEPKEECRNIPKQECKIEHKLVPKQIARQIQIRVCDEKQNERDIDTEYDLDDQQDNSEIPTQRPLIPVQPTEQPPVRILDSNQGQGDVTEILLNGRCLSWNGITCTDNDTVDVGRGPGSCDSNLDCPCCAPFCSTSGYCQTSNPISSSESCPVPNTPSNCDVNIKDTCWSPGVHDIDCPGHGLCCFDGCSNTCYNGNKAQQPGFFESNVLPIHNSANGPNIESGDCSCNDYLSQHGYGRCQKDHGDGPICYVNQPSTCTDAVNSTSENGKQYSWEACNARGSRRTPQPPTLFDEQQEYPLMDDVIGSRPGTFPCTCIDYVNKNGVGNCTHGGRDNRFKSQNVCYVALPSSCADLKNSRTDAGKFLSALACQENQRRNHLPNSATKTSHY